MSLTALAPAPVALTPEAVAVAQAVVVPTVRRRRRRASLVTTHAVSADPMPLPGTVWGAAEAVAALAESRLLPGATPADIQLVSALTTVVLRVGDHAVKVYPPGTDADHLARTNAALAGTDVALLPVAGPVVTSSGVVTVSPWLTVTGAACWWQTGALLRRFHDTHVDADVPRWEPLRRVLTQVEGLPDDAAQVLLAARERLLAEVAALESPLGVGTVHGDVSPSNVVRTADGAVLIDLDFVARAPREYDLTSAARRLEAGEIDAATYLEFCTAYGFDVRSWPGRVVLDQVAALGGVAFRLWDDRRQGRALDWLPAAVAAWRALG